MTLRKRALLDWGRTRARALKARRRVRRGKHVVWYGSGWVRLETCEILSPGPGQILVLASRTAVSPGTERAFYNRLASTHVRHPYTPGYSGSGTIIEVGRGSTGLSVGDRVAGPIPHASIATMLADQCVRVPAGLGDAEAAFLTLGIIALQGVRKSGISWGDRVAVLGRGALGTLTARIARIAGASTVVILGREGRCVSGIDDRNADTGIAKHDEQFEIVLDVTGNPEAIRDAAQLVAPSGRIVLVGSSRGNSPALDRWLVSTKSLEIRGAHAQTLPGHESSPGRWTFKDEGELFLDLVTAGRLTLFEHPMEPLDPSEAWQFYRRLGRGVPPVSAAFFDWARIPQDLRYRCSSFSFPETLWEVDASKARHATRARGTRSRGDRWPAILARARHRPEGGEKVLRFAVIGCGEIAVRNAEALVESGAAQIGWAIDTNQALAQDLARRFGGRAGSDPDVALKDPEISAAFICTPHFLHAPMGLRAVAAGKHVIVEKPLARNAEEAAALALAAAKAGVVLSTCYPMRFLPQVVAARTIVREGGLGRVAGMKVAEHIYKETFYWNGGSSGRSRSTWRASREQSGGGVLLMNLCHHLDALFFITDLRACRVYCEHERFTAPGDIEDVVAMTVRMTDGSIASVDASTCAPGGGERTFQVWGTDGQIALDDPPRFLSLKKTSFGRVNDWCGLPKGDDSEARRSFVRAFVQAVLRGSSNPAPIEASLAVQDLIDAAYRSAERGEPVEIPGSRRGALDVVAGTQD